MSAPHPKGLYLLFFTEMWERFSYYGMRALFMLYLIKAVLYTAPQASNIYGSFTGMVYLTPLLGGYLSDRYLGNRRSVLVGGLLMAVGQFLLFLSASNLGSAFCVPLLMAGLTFLCLGNGFFKPNISTMVGQLYPGKDPRVDSAYTIFYMGINVGAFFSPLVCGYLGDTGNPSDFRWGFLVACIGMLVGVAIFQLFKDKLLVSPEGRAVGLPPVAEVSAAGSGAGVAEGAANRKKAALSVLAFAAVFALLYWPCGLDAVGSFIFSACVVLPVYIISEPSLTAVERRRILVIYIIAFFVIFFWAAYEQAGASITLFTEEAVDRSMGGTTIATSYFQSLNAIYIVLLAPVVSVIWSWLGRKGIRLGVAQKQALGIFLLSCSFGMLAVATFGQEGCVCVWWVVSFYFVYTLGELCLSPIGLSMVAKLSPARFTSLLMGVWFMSTAAAQKLCGSLSALYPSRDTVTGIVAETDFFGYHIAGTHDYFVLFVVFTLVASIILFLLSRKLDKMME